MTWDTFALQEYARRSPLYLTWSQGMQQDQDLLALRAVMRPDQPPPTFFSAVNYLVFEQPGHDLACFYPVLTEQPLPASESYPVFRAFCLSHRSTLAHLLAEMRLQTNEVGRCANLLPAFELIYQRGGKRPLFLMEIGASAGLLLNWHLYQYHYPSVLSLGKRDSSVRLSCTLRGDAVPALRRNLPEVADAMGMEIAPLDLSSEHDLLWLRACIWPEEVERYSRLDAAVALARQHPPHILIGDAQDHVADVLHQVSDDVTVCVYHAYALSQGPAAPSEAILDQLAEYSRTREVYRLSLETDPHAPATAPRLDLTLYQGGGIERFDALAQCSVHGEEMQWYRQL